MQELVLELTHRFVGLIGDLYEPGLGPYGQGCGALAAGPLALAGLYAVELHAFAMKLLNRAADAAKNA